MPTKEQKHFDRIKDRIKESPKIRDIEKNLMYQKIEEYRHEDDAMRIIPEKLAEISVAIRPILKEIGLL